MAATIKIRVSQIKLWIEISIWFRGSGCGSVDRAVASDTRDPRFESRHWQTFIKHLFTVNCVEKTKIKRKEAGNGPFFLKKTWPKYCSKVRSERTNQKYYKERSFTGNFATNIFVQVLGTSLVSFSALYIDLIQHQCDQMLEQKVANSFPMSLKR